MTRKPIQAEHAIQKHIRLFVRDAVAEPHLFLAFDRSKPTSAFSHLRERARGVAKGTPDTLLCPKDKPPVWCEVKRPGKHPDDDQAAMGSRLLALGHQWFCVHSCMEYLAALAASGVELRPNASFLAHHHDASVAGEIARAEMKAGKVPAAFKPPKPTPARVRRVRKAMPGRV